MITLVIYGVIAIALAASAGYAFMSFSSSSRQLTQLQENQVQMDTAAAALRASLLALSNNGVVYAPLGTVGANYMQLPATLGVVGAAPWGQPYLYCPVSQTGTANQTGQGLTASTVQSQSGATYAIGTLSNTLTQGNSYVITNAAANAPPVAAGYVAFIVSTLGPGQTMPDCSAITVGASAPTVAGGSVRGVTAGFSFMQRVSASSDRMEIYVGNAATGDGSGRDVNNLALMDNAMALWSALQPRLGMIYLENSLTTASNFNAQDSAKLDIRGQNASLIVETDPTVVNNSGAVFTLTLTGNPLILPAATTFQYLNITGPAAIYAYKPLSFRNVTFTGPAGLTALNVYGADLLINDSTLTNVNLYAENSRISFSNDNYNPPHSLASGFANGTITANNSNISFEGGVPGIAVSYTLTPSNGIIVNSKSTNITIGPLSGGGTAAVTTTGEFALNGGSFNINTGSTLNSTTALSNFLPLTIINGSASIAGTLAANTSNNNPAIFLTGSSLYISGALQANTGNGIPYGAIDVAASTVTGNGTIKTYYTSSPCISLYTTGGAGLGSSLTDHFYPGSTPVGGVASFSQLQYGYPPLDDLATINSYNTGIAGALTQNLTLGTDPYIPPLTVAGAATQPGYLDQTSFEQGVRSIVNHEFRPGLNIYFTGACTP